MRRLTMGYLILCLSPLLSMLLMMFTPMFPMGQRPNYILQKTLQTGIHGLVISVQICGVILYLMGYRKRELESNEAFIIVVILGVFLLVWGLLAILFTIGFYGELLEWSMEPETRELTNWDYVQYATWGLKGLLWIFSGLLLIVTAWQSSQKRLSEQHGILLLCLIHRFNFWQRVKK